MNNEIKIAERIISYLVFQSIRIPLLDYNLVNKTTLSLNLTHLQVNGQAYLGEESKISI
jgi:hypothetical protein